MTQSPEPQQPTPPPAASPPAAPPPSGWAPPPTAAPVVGPAGLVYGDVPNRSIAYIIDIIILAIVNVIIGAVLSAIGLNPWTVDLNATTIGGLVTYNPLVGLLLAVIYTAISAGYFIYLWTTMRATLGQRVLGLQVGNAANGATITSEQGIKRWIALGAPFGIAQALNPLPGLGILIGLAAFAWFIALLYTTAVSPTKQGLHDKFAETIVAKVARSVA
jgi:uncharacterized RDD family membrane protein YckC